MQNWDVFGDALGFLLSAAHKQVQDRRRKLFKMKHWAVGAAV